ncbi:hypothetical protein SBADM41S_03096 [Streptomyces badius]
MISSGLRYPKPGAEDGDDGDGKPAAETVCIQLAHSFSAPASVKRSPGLPVELTLDLVDGPDNASDVAAFGLGRGWWLLGVLVLTGLVAGLLTGWISRWRISVWRTN